MNDLSWFLYAIDLVNVIGALSAVVMVASLTLYVMFCVARHEGKGDVERMARNYTQWKDDDEKKKLVDEVEKITNNQKSYSKWCKVSMTTALIAAFLFITMPSSKTMYLILGSEIGEEAINSETGKRVQNVINKKLDEYLGEDSE